MSRIGNVSKGKFMRKLRNITKGVGAMVALWVVVVIIGYVGAEIINRWGIIPLYLYIFILVGIIMGLAYGDSL